MSVLTFEYVWMKSKRRIQNVVMRNSQNLTFIAPSRLECTQKFPISGTKKKTMHSLVLFIIIAVYRPHKFADSILRTALRTKTRVPSTNTIS